MNKIIYGWLERQWRVSNHPKYQHLFEEWISNITETQIEGFTNQMNTEL